MASQRAVVPVTWENGVTAAAVPDLTDSMAARITESMSASRADGTMRAYASAWRRFEGWCQANGHVALPAHPATVAAYLVDAADTFTPDGERAFAPATLAKWVAGISHTHRRSGHISPTDHETVRATLSGIRRTYASAGDRPRKQMAPLLVTDIVTMVTVAREAVTGWASEVLERRDSALLLMGFAGAFRRSELVGLRCGDVAVHQLDGLHVRLRKSKIDQDGHGVVRALPFTVSHTSCPPCAALRWWEVVAAHERGGRSAVIRLLRTAPDFDGHLCRGAVPRISPHTPLFRSIAKNGNVSTTALSGAAVHGAVRRRAGAAGYDENLVAALGGHSLRAGFVTQAFRNGADAHAIMRQTGHKTPGMLEVYAREYTPLIGNAVADIGL
ncbi:site-specific integrase [Rhodococcus sp. NCIMB 12038]|uniref:site-specific integrase n=1 Tax=Rhodococcus sp. NCIMB 12038 TaxID=933800 RepID=UPI000B3CE127|nr:site-specific integrase [Rhodococcus sp. NCIMB 12038]OUS97261.1 integrase [Rhodococcus sp. NCIMB 12038]